MWDQGQGNYIENFINSPTCPARPRPPSPPRLGPQPPMMMYLEPPFAVIPTPPSGMVQNPNVPDAASQPPGVEGPPAPDAASQPPSVEGPVTPAAPAPPLNGTASPSGEATSSSSSSTPIGAIVGGVVGGIGGCLHRCPTRLHLLNMSAGPRALPFLALPARPVPRYAPQRPCQLPPAAPDRGCLPSACLVHLPAALLALLALLALYLRRKRARGEGDGTKDLLPVTTPPGSSPGPPPPEMHHADMPPPSPDSDAALAAKGLSHDGELDTFIAASADGKPALGLVQPPEGDGSAPATPTPTGPGGGIAPAAAAASASSAGGSPSPTVAGGSPEGLEPDVIEEHPALAVPDEEAGFTEDEVAPLPSEGLRTADGLTSAGYSSTGEFDSYIKAMVANNLWSISTGGSARIAAEGAPPGEDASKAARGAGVGVDSSSGANSMASGTGSGTVVTPTTAAEQPTGTPLAGSSGESRQVASPPVAADCSASGLAVTPCRRGLQPDVASAPHSSAIPLLHACPLHRSLNGRLAFPPPCSQPLSIEEDALLAAISSRLGSAAQREAGAGGGAGGEHPLSADVQQWRVDWRDIRLERVIGGGSFGRVYLGTWKETQVSLLWMCVFVWWR